MAISSQGNSGDWITEIELLYVNKRSVEYNSFQSAGQREFANFGKTKVAGYVHMGYGYICTCQGWCSLHGPKVIREEEKQKRKEKNNNNKHTQNKTSMINVRGKSM